MSAELIKADLEKFNRPDAGTVVRFNINGYEHVGIYDGYSDKWFLTGSIKSPRTEMTHEELMKLISNPLSCRFIYTATNWDVVRYKGGIPEERVIVSSDGEVLVGTLPEESLGF
jgi:hypothetical protein